jgi:hypothetical protein
MGRNFTMAKTEKPERRFPRYHCQGDTRIRPNGEWKALGNAMTQISQAGCYIVTPEPYPEGTELELELEAGGQPVRVRGIVIYTHPSKGMGVAFMQTGEEEEALKELLTGMPQSFPDA